MFKGTPKLRGSELRGCKQRGDSFPLVRTQACGASCESAAAGVLTAPRPTGQGQTQGLWGCFCKIMLIITLNQCH